jgi:hypothetical protein
MVRNKIDRGNSDNGATYLSYSQWLSERKSERDLQAAAIKTLGSLSPKRISKQGIYRSLSNE